jgi:predicted double-glycine peptidase
LNVLRLKGNSSYTEEKMSKKCNAKPGIGTMEADMVRVAKEIGLEVIETEEGGALKDIERNLDDGKYVIVCYMHAYSGEGHYGVITEYDKRAFYFVDPSFGLFRLRKEYFSKWWYGSDGVKQWYMAVK